MIYSSFWQFCTSVLPSSSSACCILILPCASILAACKMLNNRGIIVYLQSNFHAEIVINFRTNTVHGITKNLNILETNYFSMLTHNYIIFFFVQWIAGFLLNLIMIKTTVLKSVFLISHSVILRQFRVRKFNIKYIY